MIRVLFIISDYSLETNLFTLTGIGSIVEWITGHQSAAVQSSGQHELYLRRPFFDGVCFRLPSFVILLEIVWEVAVQVKTACVVPTLTTVTLTLAGHFKTVRIHRWQNMNTSVVQKPADVRVYRVTVHQILRKPLWNVFKDFS